MRLCDFLRVPALFIMDQIFKISFGFEDIDDTISKSNNAFENDGFIQCFMLVFQFFIKIIVSCLSKFDTFS